MYCIYVIVVLIIIYFWYYQVDIVRSSVDDRKYKVIRQNNLDNPEYAADLLAKINRNLIETIRVLRDKYIRNRVNRRGGSGNSDEIPEDEMTGFITRLLKNYDPDVVRENRPLTTENTSFVQNKGQDVAFCLRKNMNGDYHDDFNLLQFVSLHELTHIGTAGYGHGDEFWKFFKFVLVEATDSGLYVPKDYSKNPISYCGLQIDHNPYFD